MAISVEEALMTVVWAVAALAFAWEGIAADKGRGGLSFMGCALFFIFCLLVRSFVHVLCVARPPKKNHR